MGQSGYWKQGISSKWPDSRLFPSGAIIFQKRQNSVSPDRTGFRDSPSRLANCHEMSCFRKLLFFSIPTLASSPGPLRRKEGLVHTVCARVKVYRKSWYIAYCRIIFSKLCLYDYVILLNLLPSCHRLYASLPRKGQLITKTKN